MVLASSGGAPPPAWLDTLGTVAGVLLVLELLIVLIVMLALMVALALGARWVHMNVIPVLREQTPKLQRAMDVADTSTDRVVQGVAEFYGRRQAVETGLRVFLFGRRQARAVRQAAEVRAAADIQLIDASAATERTLTGPGGGFTPRLNVAEDADVAPTVGTGREGAGPRPRAGERDRDRRPGDGRRDGHNGHDGHDGPLTAPAG